ncbi:MAG: DNA polymerase clamp loader subunit A [Methylococcales bacterium]|jgi:hypothetical protein
MDINDTFGQPVKEPETFEYKAPAISPFDFVNSINYDKNDLVVDDWSEKQYVPFLVNKALSYGADTVIPANEMNSRPHLDKKLQFQFLINSIRPKKRYNKWVKAEKIESIEVIKQYYGYSTEKARQVIPLLDQSKIDYLKQKLEKGGINNVKRVLQN